MNGAMGATEQHNVGFPYTIEGVLGETDTTTIYAAVAGQGGGAAKRVVLERLATHDAAERDHFFAMAELAQRVGHAPQRRMLELGDVDGQPCFVWEALAGLSLEALFTHQGGRPSEDRAMAVACVLVSQAAEHWAELMAAGVPSQRLAVRPADLWILADGSTRVRLLERLLHAGSSGSGQEGVATLGSCLWWLLLGDVPTPRGEAVGGEAVVVPANLTTLPVTLQGILLEAVAPNATPDNFDPMRLANALRSFVTQEVGNVTRADLVDLVVGAGTDHDARPPIQSGVSEILAASEQPVVAPVAPIAPRVPALAVATEATPLAPAEADWALDDDGPTALDVDVVVESDHASEVELPDISPALNDFAGLELPSTSSPYTWGGVSQQPSQGQPRFGKSRFDSLPELPALEPKGRPAPLAAPTRRRRPPSTARGRSRRGHSRSGQVRGGKRTSRRWAMMFLGMMAAGAAGAGIGWWWTQTAGKGLPAPLEQFGLANQ